MEAEDTHTHATDGGGRPGAGTSSSGRLKVSLVDCGKSSQIQHSKWLNDRQTTMNGLESDMSTSNCETFGPSERASEWGDMPASYLCRLYNDIHVYLSTTAVKT